MHYYSELVGPANPGFDFRTQFFELSLDLCCISDFHGKFLHVNRAWTELLGWEAEELVSRSYFELIHPDDLVRTQQASGLANGNRFEGFANRYRTKDGGYRWLHWSGKIDLENQLFYGIARDITVEKEAALRHAELEKRLEESEASFRQMAANVPGVLYRFVLRTNGEMGFAYVSPACEAIFGLTQDELPIEFPRLMAHMRPEELSAWRTSVERSARELSLWLWEGRVPTPTGEKWIRARSMPRELPNGDIEWDGMMVDVTAEKASEELIEQQRTRLIHASKMAALGEMAGGVAHEINNPLAIIMGKAWQLKGLTERGPLEPEKVREFAERIEKTGDRIAKIVRGLRFLARNGEGDPFEVKPLARIVEDTLELSQARFAHHGVELRIPQIPPGLELECRSVQISQVLLNLLNNAFDAIQDREPRWVQIECADRVDRVELVVTDCGPGIPPEIAERLMTPFFTTKGTGKGTGLGLSLSRGIVESHGGHLSLDHAHPNTRFVMRLPKRQPSSP